MNKGYSYSSLKNTNDYVGDNITVYSDVDFQGRLRTFPVDNYSVFLNSDGKLTAEAGFASDSYFSNIYVDNVFEYTSDNGIHFHDPVYITELNVSDIHCWNLWVSDHIYTQSLRVYGNEVISGTIYSSIIDNSQNIYTPELAVNIINPLASNTHINIANDVGHYIDTNTLMASSIETQKIKIDDLTPTRVPYCGSDGNLTDSATLYYNAGLGRLYTDRLSVISITGLTSDLYLSGRSGGDYVNVGSTGLRASRISPYLYSTIDIAINSDEYIRTQKITPFGSTNINIAADSGETLITNSLNSSSIYVDVIDSNHGIVYLEGTTFNSGKIGCSQITSPYVYANVIYSTSVSCNTLIASSVISNSHEPESGAIIYNTRGYSADKLFGLTSANCNIFQQYTAGGNVILRNGSTSTSNDSVQINSQSGGVSISPASNKNIALNLTDFGKVAISANQDSTLQISRNSTNWNAQVNYYNTDSFLWTHGVLGNDSNRFRIYGGSDPNYVMSIDYVSKETTFGYNVNVPTLTASSVSAYALKSYYTSCNTLTTVGNVNCNGVLNQSAYADGDKIYLLGTTNAAKITHAGGWIVGHYAGATTSALTGQFNWYNVNASNAFESKMNLANNGTLTLGTGSISSPSITPRLNLNTNTTGTAHLTLTGKDYFGSDSSNGVALLLGKNQTNLRYLTIADSANTSSTSGGMRMWVDSSGASNIDAKSLNGATNKDFNLYGNVVYLNGFSGFNIGCGTGNLEVAATTGFKLTSNRMTNASQPCISVQCSSAVSNITGDGTTWVMTCNSENFDQGGDYDTSTYKFTAPVNGRYLCTASIWTYGYNGSHNASSAQFYDGTTQYTGYDVNPANVRDNSAYMHLSFSRIINLTAGAYLQVRLAVGGSTKTVSADGGWTCCLLC